MRMCSPDPNSIDTRKHPKITTSTVFMTFTSLWRVNKICCKTKENFVLCFPEFIVKETLRWKVRATKTASFWHQGSMPILFDDINFAYRREVKCMGTFFMWIHSAAIWIYAFLQEIQFPCAQSGDNYHIPDIPPDTSKYAMSVVDNSTPAREAHSPGRVPGNIVEHPSENSLLWMLTHLSSPEWQWRSRILEALTSTSQNRSPAKSLSRVEWRFM